jgi:hypothetical protein
MTRKRGRKPIGDGPATAKVELRVTPAQRLELRRVASENRTGVAGLLREAVNEYVADSHERRLFVRQK